MKTPVALLVFALAAASGFCAAPVKKAVPTAAAKVDNTAKIQTAVTAAVKAHIADRKDYGDSRTRLISTTVAAGATEAVTGWVNRYRTTGTATLTLMTSGKQEKQTRTYDVLSEVNGAGAVTVVDVSTR